MSTARQTSTFVTPVPCRPTLSLARVEPVISAVVGVDPEGFTRYALETPTLAVTRHREAIFANGVHFASSTFRFYRLRI